MSAKFLPFLILWGLMAVGVVAMILWRKTVASAEDDSLHVLNAENVVPQQVAMAHKLDVIDKWGKMLTAATVVYGIVLAAVYFYQLWVSTSTTIQG